MRPRCFLPAAVALLILRSIAESASPLTDADMASRVDERLSNAWSAAEIQPVPAASDAEFLRRAWLDLCGIVPPVNDDDGSSGVRDFLNDQGPDKRERLIDALLARPQHATHLSNVWTNALLPADSNVQVFRADIGISELVARAVCGECAL